MTRKSFKLQELLHLGDTNDQNFLLALQLMRAGVTDYYEVKQSELANLLTGNIEKGRFYLVIGAVQGLTQTSGTLVKGRSYTITTFQTGDDFLNVGAISNATGVQFIATGTTPSTFSNSSTITENKIVLLLGETDSTFSAYCFNLTDNSFGTYNASTDVFTGDAKTSSLQYAAPTAGQTVTSNGSEKLYLNMAGTLATLTVVMPANPRNGQRFSVTPNHIVTTLTMTGSGVSAFAANTTVSFFYSVDAAGWIKE